MTRLTMCRNHTWISPITLKLPTNWIKWDDQWHGRHDSCSCCHLGLWDIWERLISRREKVPLQSNDFVIMWWALPPPTAVDFVVWEGGPISCTNNYVHMADCCGEIRVWRGSYKKFGIFYFEAGKQDFLECFFFLYAAKIVYFPQLFLPLSVCLCFTLLSLLFFNSKRTFGESRLFPERLCFPPKIIIYTL